MSLFLQDGDTVIMIHTLYLKVIFTCQKIIIRNNFIIVILFEQTLRDIIHLVHAAAELDVKKRMELVLS